MVFTLILIFALFLFLQFHDFEIRDFRDLFVGDATRLAFNHQSVLFQNVKRLGRFSAPPPLIF
jgi:hypothetical protein